MRDRIDGRDRASSVCRRRTESPPPINLEPIEGAFVTREGFSRPCWPVILKALRHQHSPAARLAAWTDVVSPWTSRWEVELGNDCWMTRSESFILVSELDADLAERILQRANWLAEKIRSVLSLHNCADYCSICYNNRYARTTFGS